MAAIVVSYLLTFLLVDNMATTNSTVKLMAGFVSGNVVFYAVLIPNRWLVRNTSIRMVLVNTVKEFGLAELFDTGFIRPALIFVCFWLTQSETMGSTWGHGWRIWFSTIWGLATLASKSRKPSGRSWPASSIRRLAFEFNNPRRRQLNLSAPQLFYAIKADGY